MGKRSLIILVGLIVVSIFLVYKFVDGKKSAEDQATSSSSKTAQQLYKRAIDYKKNYEKLKAKEVYQEILSDYSDFENIESAQKELEDLNIEIITSSVETSQTVIHDVQSGDTLGKLAKKYNTTIELIKIRNDLKSNVIRIGQRISIWTGSFNIFVDKSQNIFMLRNNDEIVKTYTVSTGKDVGVTPIGEFVIVNKLINPVWFNKGVVVPPESPANVLGSRWMGFDLSGYGIHGTIYPETIGSHETAGCVRMHNEDVEEVYSMVPRGIKVVIVD